MNDKNIPAQLLIDPDGACSIALECWRLSRIAERLNDNNQSAGLRYAVRRITEVLKEMGVEVVDLTGRPYDPGMVPEVVEVQEDLALSDGHALIAETIAPTVTWLGQVIKPGQIIVTRSPVVPQEQIKVD